MKKIYDTMFDTKKQKWIFGFTNEKVSATIFWYKNGKMDFMIENEEVVFTKTENDKETEMFRNTPLFQSTIQQIVDWEEMMKNKLAISDISFLKKEKEEETGKDLYFFTFNLNSRVAMGQYVLEKGIQEIEESFIEFRKEKFAFIIVLEKKERNGKMQFNVMDGYPIYPFKNFLNNKNMVGDYYGQNHVKFNKRNTFYTHRTFAEDITKIISNEPSVRLKTLLLH